MKRRTLVDEILAPGGLTILFQPIFEIVNGQSMLFALEALSRGSKGTNLERADVLFEYVRRMNRELDVDRACVSAAIAAAASVPGSPAISINVHASTLERDEHFASYLAERCVEHGVRIDRIVLEIVEHQRFRDANTFFAALDGLRALGVRIALDDIGLGYSNHQMLIEVCPDLFKIDRFFVDGCSARPHSRAAIESIALLASRLGGRVVAEGIETPEDFAAISALGIDLVQGYYFGRPAAPASQTTQKEKV